MNEELSALPTIAAVDRATDLLYIVDTSAGSSNKVTPNNLLGIVGSPLGTTDTQTITNKTISGANNTITNINPANVTGLPSVASIVTLTGSQTLTGKTLTSPTINTATISSVNNAKLATGVPVQVVSVGSSAVATGTTTIPVDDTIPQITEGNEFMTLAITPRSATNRLLIRVVFHLSHGSVSTANLVAALFQDSTANALAQLLLMARLALDYLAQLQNHLLQLQNIKCSHD